MLCRPQLTGPVSNVLNNLKALKYLYAGTNEFLETVDETFLANNLQLREVTLDHNLLSTAKQTGFPVSLLEHQRLEMLDLSDNNMQGTLPESTRSNHQLRFLALNNNDLSGTIPWGLQSFNGLEYLDISQNNLIGESKSLSCVLRWFNFCLLTILFRFCFLFATKFLLRSGTSRAFDSSTWATIILLPSQFRARSLP